ncbi:MAG TPA: diguanylate cyclase [Stenomitos sp.]
MEHLPLALPTWPPLDGASSDELAHFAAAYQALSGVESRADLLSALLLVTVRLTGARRAVLADAAGEVLAAYPDAPDEAAPALALEVPEGLYPLPDHPGDWIWRFDLAGAPLAMRLEAPSGMPALANRPTLGLIMGVASERDRFLHVRHEAEEAQAEAKLAHERQMEMALDLYDLYEEAQQQAITDGLTGLSTHAFFQQRFADDFHESVDNQQELCLLLFDLDHFKSINDQHGHQAGDVVLKEAAALIKGNMRLTDLAARYGGEEFAVILPQTSVDEAWALAERLREELAALEIPINPERKLTVTASIGLAHRLPTDASPKELIKRVDTALYAAKNGGRNRVVRAQAANVAAVNAIGAPRKGSQEMFLALARALSAAIEARSPMLHGHSEAVGELALRMGKALGLPPEKQEALMIAGMLHDVGMLALSDSVLQSKELTEAEWAQMKEHPRTGVAILSKFSSFSGLREAVLYHHERWDGKGYPEGLKEEAIPLSAQILAVCDTYDAMLRSGYAFGRLMSPEAAMAELRRCAGTQFNPQVVDVLLSVVRPLE